VGLVVLVVVTAILVTLAVLKTWTPPAQAAPRQATSQNPGPPSPATLTTAAPPTQTPATTPRAGLAGIGDILNAPAGASVLVIGDDSGDAADEWVATWAREHLSQQATVSYHPWNRTAGTYADAVAFGSGTRALTIWNASSGSPNMTTEPARAQQAWKDADVVLLSYGHGRDAKLIGPQLDAVMAAVRGRDATVPVAVLLQNPERAATEATQRDVTQAIKAWADAKGLPTVDVYGAFVADPAGRNALVQSDGSPTPQGSTLWAKTLAQAVSA